MKEVLSAITQSRLSETEACVYHTLLKHDELSISTLAKESDISRANVYIILKKLNSSGLISCSKIDKREHILGVHPKRLSQNKNLANAKFLFCQDEKNEPSRASTKWGRVVEDVRTIFEEKNDTTIYIPVF